MRTVGKSRWNRPRRLLAALIAVIGLLAPAACSSSSGAGGAENNSTYIDGIVQSGQLRIGVAASAPWIYQDPKSGKWNGVYFDAMEYVADRLNVKLVPVATSWNDIVAGLQAGKYDVAVGLNQTLERSQQVLYTNSLVSVLTAFGVHKNGPNTWAAISSPSSKVCVVQGTPQVAALQSLKDFKAELEVLPSVEACQLAFSSGRVDADAEDWLNLAAYSNAHSDAGILFAPTPIALQGVGYGLPRSTSYADLQVINSGLTEFENSGLLAESLKANSVVDPMQYAIGAVPAYAKSIATFY
jgi:polar amino acid transport system substrate-binding protein